MLKPDYCVVIPARNAERFIAATLASVQQQTLPPSEIVVIDDGSDDRTAAVATAAGAKVIRRPASHGPSASRNLGVAETDAPLIAFLDADDEWKPEHAERVVDALSTADVAFAGSDAEHFGSGSGISRSFQSELNPIDLRDMLVTDNPVIQSSVIVRRDAFELAGGYDETMFLSEDYDLWTRIAEYGMYSHVDAATVRRRMHAEQISQRYRAELVRAWWGVRRRLLARRLIEAEGYERDRLLRLLDAASQADLDWAIWTGDGTMLTIVREELRTTDQELALDDRLNAVSGLKSPSRRLSQDVRCASRSILQMVRGDR